MSGRAKIRVVSDGTRPGTNVLAVTPNGDETALSGVTGLDWTIDVKTGVATATLRIHRARLDALLDATNAIAILEPAPRRLRYRPTPGTLAAGAAGIVAALYGQPLWLGILTALAAGALTDGLIWIAGKYSGSYSGPSPEEPKPEHVRVAAEAAERLTATAFRQQRPPAAACPRCGATDPWDRRPVNVAGEGIVPCPHAWHEHAAWRGRTMAGQWQAITDDFWDAFGDLVDTHRHWKPWFDVDELEHAILARLEDADHDGGFSATGYHPASGLTPEEWQAKRLTADVLAFLFHVDSRRVNQRRAT